MPVEVFYRTEKKGMHKKSPYMIENMLNNVPDIDSCESFSHNILDTPDPVSVRDSFEYQKENSMFAAGFCSTAISNPTERERFARQNTMKNLLKQRIAKDNRYSLPT